MAVANAEVKRAGVVNRATVRVLVSMAVCYAVVELVLLRVARDGLLDPLRAGMATRATSLLLAFGRPVALSGFSVATNAGLVTVAVGCLPVVHVALIVALFGFGVSSPLRRRIAWIVGLTVAALAVEVVRIAGVARLLEAGAPYLEFVHLTVMPIVTLGVIVGCWLFELQKSHPQ